MIQKLTLVCLFLTFYYGNTQQFSVENLQTTERIEVALDSSYLWLEERNAKDFIKNYTAIGEAIDLSKNKEFRARLNSYMATLYFYLYDYDKFDFYLNEALDYYEKRDNSKMLIYVYNLKSLYETFKNKDHNKSIEWSLKALDLYDVNSEKNGPMLVDLYFCITLSYYEIKDWNNTYRTASKCIELAKKYNIESRLRRMYYFKGISLFHKNDINGAIDNFKLCEILFKKEKAVSGNKIYYKRAEYLDGFSKVYRVLGDYKKSTDYAIEYNNLVTNSMYPYIFDLSFKIKEESDLLVNQAIQNKEKAQKELKNKETLYNYLLIGVAILIISGLLSLLFLQRKHQKLNIKKNKLLRFKNNEVENALKVKTDFLNSITHELRTPLYAINSITDMIKHSEENFMDSSQVDILSFSGDHLLRFINDVIDFNQGNKSFEFQSLNFEHCNLETLLLNIKKIIKLSLRINNENNYEYDIDSSIPECLGVDTLKLSRVIINLLNNASKNTHNGNISLKVRQLSGNSQSSVIEFSVIDTGIGISKKQLNEINLAFNENLDLVKRIDNTASGLGLGLVMVNRLLELHESKLIIETEEGKGTTMKFVIKFDVLKKNVQESKLHIINTKPKGIHMLIVDDNKINQMVTSKVVIKAGFTCDIVGGGNEAINLLKKNDNYDFILMDIMMPGMDGFETAKIIKEFSPRQKIIALTAMSIKENKQLFLESGFVNVIEKPFVIKNFNVLINSLTA